MAADQKLARKAAGAILLAQHETQASLAKAVQESHAAMAAHLRQKKDRDKRAAIIGVLLLLSPMLAGKLRASLVDGRQAARRAATKRLVAELAIAGITISPHDLGASRPLVMAAGLARRHEDETMATMAADSLVVQWRGVELYEAGKDRPAAAAARMTARTERTASSEVAHAYNDEHRSALADAIRYDDRLGDELREADVVRQWSALLDACERCSPHDGEQVAIGDSFSGGDEPGEMHPRCMCAELLITVGASPKRAA